MRKPIIAITMGDPAGIGPETCISTILDERVHNSCKPFIIGSVGVLKKASKNLNKKFEINLVKEVSDCKFKIGTIDIMETKDYDISSLEWGKVQKDAGQMSIDWIQKSIDLGINGDIDGVSTTPINKEAIKLAGIKEPGHTEYYQTKTNSDYALTMFSCHKLRVFFVSRHMSLIDACKYATKERILEDLKNIDFELKNIGIDNPYIAVAGLNPHNGDNGLFGREEIDELEPAVNEAKKLGINAVGPLPADSIFHIGKSGKFDAILSLYHDQGHIACKTLDFEKSVTLTFGLPFIRGSVDHGTAFDIAGTGKANPISLIESTCVIAEYASKKINKE